MARFISFMIIAWIAAWFGGASVGQLFAGISLFFLGSLCFVVTILSWALGRIGLRGFGLFVIFVFFAIAYYWGTTTKYTMSDLDRVTITENIPVSLEKIYLSNGDFRGHVRLVNKSNDMLNHAEVVCQLFMDNGQPFHKTFRNGIGGNEVQFPPNTGATTVVVQTSFWNKYRIDRNATECKVTSATFFERMPFINKLDLTWKVNPRDGKNDFFVTNNTDQKIKNVQFVCVTEDDRTRKVNFLPAYIDDVSKDTVIEPGKTVQYIDDEAIWNYKHCVISNAVAF